MKKSVVSASVNLRVTPPVDMPVVVTGQAVVFMIFVVGAVCLAVYLVDQNDENKNRKKIVYRYLNIRYGNL